MSKNAPQPAPDLQPHERRRLERKPALLRAVIVEASGQNVRDCFIVDINAGGAQVSATISFPNGTEVYLLDVGNQIAYSAKVVWSKSDRSGLSFADCHRMATGLPLHQSFLWKLLLEAKLRDIERNIGNGISAGSAFMNAGLSGVELDLMARRAAGDAGFEEALQRARMLLNVDTQ